MTRRRYVFPFLGSGTAILTVVVAALFLALPVHARPATCQPGSGPDLSGRTFSAADLEKLGEVRCADLPEPYSMVSS
ncbi:MAG: hypothetical protein GEU79_18695, partial [Acidimicrobiia bacterium]|nr:hypothetical protein [Acidimicrobiia bacterium]